MRCCAKIVIYTGISQKMSAGLFNARETGVVFVISKQASTDEFRDTILPSGVSGSVLRDAILPSKNFLVNFVTRFALRSRATGFKAGDLQQEYCSTMEDDYFGNIH